METLLQAIVASPSASEAAKKDLLDWTNMLAEAIKKPEERKQSVIRLVATGLGDALGNFADLATVWEAVGPVILSALGL